MRILLMTPMPPDARAGGAMPSVFHAQVEGLCERHDVTLVTVAGPDPHELAALERLGTAGVDAHAVRRVVPAGRALWLRRRRMAASWMRGRYPWRTVWFAEPGVQRVLDELFRHRRFDVVATEDNSMGVYQLPIEVATVLTEHEVRRPRPLDLRMGAPRSWPARAFSELDWRRWQRYQRAVWRRFDALQVFTERDAAGVRTVAPDLAARVRVNPFGMDLPAASTAVEEPCSAIFFGNFFHPPNVDAALWLGREVMPRLRAMSAGVRLSIAGMRPPATVRALAGPDVRVLGFVDDLDALIAASEIVLAPVRIGGGMRMKVLHAMALGKAVVTTSRGIDGLTDVGGMPPVALGDDAAEAATITARLLRHDGERRELGRRARAFVTEHHSVRAYARRLEASYAFALERHRRRDGRR